MCYGICEESFVIIYIYTCIMNFNQVQIYKCYIFYIYAINEK